jgi:hypothetical protein
MHQEKAEMRKMMKMIKKNLDNPKHNPILWNTGLTFEGAEVRKLQTSNLLLNKSN